MTGASSHHGEIRPAPSERAATATSKRPLMRRAFPNRRFRSSLRACSLRQRSRRCWYSLRGSKYLRLPVGYALLAQARGMLGIW